MIKLKVMIPYSVALFIASMSLVGCSNSDSEASSSTPHTLVHEANYAEVKDGDSFGYGSSVAASDDGQLVAVGSSNQRLQCTET
ncbi:MAG: hypothetical protein ISP86_04350, partial [Shewanellaceae bacterium]|nr:hypothetical protein [Shewanellaceae bacterium]